MPYEEKTKKLIKAAFGDTPGVFHVHVDHQSGCFFPVSKCTCNPKLTLKSANLDSSNDNKEKP